MTPRPSARRVVFLYLVCQALTCACVCADVRERRKTIGRRPLKDIYMVLKEEKLSSNMVSLLNNLKREKRQTEHDDAAVIKSPADATLTYVSKDPSIFLVGDTLSTVTSPTMDLVRTSERDTSNYIESALMKIICGSSRRPEICENNPRAIEQLAYYSEASTEDDSSLRMENFLSVVEREALSERSITTVSLATTESFENALLKDIVRYASTADKAPWSPGISDYSKRDIEVNVTKRSNGVSASETLGEELLAATAIVNGRDTTEGDEEDQKLEKILNILESMQRQYSGSEDDEVNQTNELPCSVEGVWSSSAGGMLLEVKKKSEDSYTVALSLKSPVSRKGFLVDDGWQLSACSPIAKTNLVYANGINDKDKIMAIFLGECRNCDGEDLVTGNWLIKRASRDCIDMEATQEMRSDVWRREKLTKLRENRLRSLEEEKVLVKKGHGKKHKKPLFASNTTTTTANVAAEERRQPTPRVQHAIIFKGTVRESSTTSTTSTITRTAGTPRTTANERTAVAVMAKKSITSAASTAGTTTKTP